jgi:hypothetical protein
MRARPSDWDRWRPIRLDQGTSKDRPREHAAMLVALLISASPTQRVVGRGPMRAHGFRKLGGVYPRSQRGLQRRDKVRLLNFTLSGNASIQRQNQR